MIKSLFWFVANLFVLASLAAGYVDDDSQTVEIDASLKGNLSSPFYGKRSKYPTNQLREYKLIAPFRHKIKITFKDFDLFPSSGCAEDSLTISEFNPGLILFCGQELPRPVLSKSNEVTITFETNSIQGGRGFLLEYESGPYMQICDSGFRLCRNRNCYHRKKECDGEDDCGDGTDEEDCGHPLVVTPSECGTPAIPPRISQGADRLIGGEEVVPNSWPWYVSLQLPECEPYADTCGGTLINSMWVLTSAGCALRFSEPPEETRVILGSHGMFTKTPYQQVRYSTRVFSHPGFTGTRDNVTSLHDISLIRLNAPAVLNAGVHPACLPYWGSNPKPGWQCYATGWGTKTGSGSSGNLQQTLQVVKSQEECSEDLYHPKPPAVSDEASQLCVGNTGQYVCELDKGGPLQCKEKDKKWYVMGVISYTTPLDKSGYTICGARGAKTFYASTALDYDWINDIIDKYTNI